MSDTAPAQVESTTSAEAEEAAAVDLGPFSPPADFVFPDEFDAPVPRAIPAKLKRGRYWTRNQRGVAVGMVLAAGCFLYAHTPFVVELAHYFLPLGYLDWVGLGLAVLAASVWVCMRFFIRRFVFIRDGVPVVARIRAVTRVLQNVNGQDQLRFWVQFEYRDPGTGDLEQFNYQTAVVNLLFEEKKFDLAFGPGDYVTAVVVQGRDQSTAAPYGLLELSPDEDTILYEGRPWTGVSTFMAGLCVLAFVGILTAVTYGLYLFKFMDPIGSYAPFGYGAIIGAVLGPIAAALAEVSVTKRKSRAVSFPWKGGLAGLVLGPIAGMMAVGGINTAFDSSSPEYREVSVVQFFQTTYVHMIRNYSVQYRELRSGETRSTPARLQEMREFSVRLGVIEVKDGALGMPWVRRIIPAVPMELGHRPRLPRYPRGQPF